MKRFFQGIAVAIVSLVSVALPTSVAFGAFTQFGLQGIYNATPFTLTNGQGSAVSTDVQGRVILSPSSSLSTITATSGVFATITATTGTISNLTVTVLASSSKFSYVPVNTTSHAARVMIQGAGTENPLTIVTSTAGAANMFTVLTSGFVGIGNGVPTTDLDINGGAIYVGGDTFDQSFSGGATLVLGTAGHRALHVDGSSGRQGVLAVEGGSFANLYLSGFDGGTTGSKLWNLSSEASTNNLYLKNMSEVSAATNVTAFTVDRLGRFSFNTTSISSRLYVVGSGLENPFAIVSSTPGAESMFTILTNGNVGVNSSSPMNKFSSQGEVSMLGLGVNITGNGVGITATGTLVDCGAAACIPSALKYKDKVTPYQKSAVELFKELVQAGAVQNYELKGKAGDPRKGLIADIVEKVDKDLVGYSLDGSVNTLHFEDLTGLAVKAVAELEDKNSALEKRVEKLESAPSDDRKMKVAVGLLFIAMFATWGAMIVNKNK